jgi:UDP-MurNAc hydroxylase
MQLTVIGHSCLFFQTGAGSILVDPWLVGSAYWRSWWHYPPTAEVRDEWLHPDFVYFTHHHFDHLHYPSARLLDKHTQVLIPRFGVDVMRAEMESIGFTRVRELDHGQLLDLGHGVQVGSFQYGFDDTAFAVRDGSDVAIDVNDCKIRGRALRRLVEEVGRPTFVFKSYSFAQSYPIAYTATDEADLGIIERTTYIDDFIGRMREFRPRYAVPFGSMIAFLHPASRDLNQHLVSPHEVASAAEEADLDPTQTVVMSPGDSWDSTSGFAISDEDWYADKEQRIEALAEKAQPRLDDQARREAGKTLDWAAFERYFSGFVRALPPFVGRLACSRPTVFHVPSSSEPYWTVDVRRRRVVRSTTPPDDRSGMTRIDEALLADAIEKKLVNYIHISTRMRVHLEPGGAGSDLGFWALIAIWEIGYLDLRVLLSPRFLRVLWRRRDEVFEMLGALRGKGSLSQRMAGQFAEAD